MGSRAALVNVYRTRNSLIFKSETGEVDTSIIVKSETFYPQYNPIEVHDEFLPQRGMVWYTNKHLDYHPDGFEHS
jgi:hypothetical protein